MSHFPRLSLATTDPKQMYNIGMDQGIGLISISRDLIFVTFDD